MRYIDLFEKAVTDVPNFKQKFRPTNKTIDLDNLGLTSFEGLPSSVGDLYFGGNAFTSFEHCPTEIRGSLIGQYNSANIVSLKGLGTVGSVLSLEHCNLLSLEGCPDVVQHLTVEHNKLTSLKGCASRVEHQFDFRNNPIQSWEGAPKYIGKWCGVAATPSLAGFSKYFPEIHGNLILENLPTNMLSVFYIVGLQFIEVNDSWKDPRIEECLDIFEKHLPMGKKGLMPCQSALIKAGFKDQAKL